MLRSELLKYILDIESIVAELEKIIEVYARDYTQFSSDFIAVRAAERDLMIIGEAIGKILKLDPEVRISNTKHIISLRNMIVHAYDSVDPTILWRILVKDIPVLKDEILRIKG